MRLSLVPFCLRAYSAYAAYVENGVCTQFAKCREY